jgi:hypothetical protein
MPASCRADFMDVLDDVRAGALGAAYIDAAADSRVHVFDELQYVERRGSLLMRLKRDLRYRCGAQPFS